VEGGEMKELTEAQESLWADDAWDFIQTQILRGIPCMVVRCGPGAPHVCIGKSQLANAAQILRDCAEVVAAYDTHPGPFN
jgi:hypothetical protein